MSKPNHPITPKDLREKKFAQEIAEGKTAKDAYSETHDTSNYGEKALRVQASRYLKRKGVQSELAKYSDLSEAVLMDTMQDFGQADSWRERGVALDAAKFVHDKVHGKATQKIEQTSTTLSINLDLTGVTDDSEDMIDVQNQAE